jgi:type I restriction enzyme R subunit
MAPPPQKIATPLADPSQFAFLQAEFRNVFGFAACAETLARTDPRGAALYCRLALESAVAWLYRHDGTLNEPADPTLAALLAEPGLQALLGHALAVKARFVKDVGNAAVQGEPVSAAEAADSLGELFDIAFWLARTYARGAKPAAGAAFRSEALPSAQAAALGLAELQELARRFKALAEARKAVEAERAASPEGGPAIEAEIKARHAETAAAKAANLRERMD